MVVLAVVGTMLWGGPVTNLWARTFVEPCPPGNPARDCVATLSGLVLDRFDDPGDNDTTIRLTVPDSPTGADVGVTLTPVFDTANRLGITGRTPEPERVTVTMYDGHVETITGPTGRSAANTTVWVSEALLRLLAMSGVAIIAVVGGGYLLRRLRNGPTGWSRRPAISMAVGALTGMAAGLVAADALGAGWVMPVAFASTAVVGAAVTFLRLPRSWSPTRTPDGKGRGNGSGVL
jgi:hypothetical protein